MLLLKDHYSCYPNPINMYMLYIFGQRHSEDGRIEVYLILDVELRIINDLVAEDLWLLNPQIRGNFGIYIFTCNKDDIDPVDI